MKSGTSSISTSSPPVWDYALSKQDFDAIICDNSDSSFSDVWAVSRLLQHRSFYEVIATISIPKLRSLWPQVKPTILSKDIVSAYEYYLHKALPVAN